ncbi:hypothetical protein CPB84DRAFT_1852555 [Gymnopilus junonius]|uniref:F-box domain-containing protein n=1 Tax=Gymnopilus junonius TaxID=109634 RepID=A0A9P5TI53_GYMJU|nr:hypothetical protein CPB84DRAFT_1852555 [Gymnopilus junonius]
MKQIEAEIAAAKDRLNELFERHRKARAQMNALHDPMSARFPVEIGSKIFEMCIPTELFGYPIYLGALCQNWRKIAWSTPGVWNFIDIDADRLAKWVELQDIAVEWLFRSCDLPLTVKVHSSSTSSDEKTILCVQALAEYLNELSPRWQTLDLALPGECFSLFHGKGLACPLLHTLKLKKYGHHSQECDFYLENAKPRELLLGDSVTLKSLQVGFYNLTRANVPCFDAEECAGFFKQAALLESCVVRFTGRQADSPLLGEVIVSHIFANSNLTFKDLGYGALKGDTILSFLTRSSCHLRKLRISESPFDNNEIVSLLGGVPSLQHLNIHPYESDDEDFLESLAEAIAQENVGEVQFLPLLKSFRYLICDPLLWTWDQLLDSLDKLGPGRRPLKTMRIYLSTWQGFYLDVDSLARIDKLSQAGLKLMIYEGFKSVNIIKRSRNYHLKQLQASSKLANPKAGPVLEDSAVQ